MKNIQGLKDKTIFIGWITLLLFLIALFWILTQPLQRNYLLRTVNSVLIAAGDSRRITGYIGQNSINPNIPGYWYSMHDSSDQMFIFSVFQDGILIPLGAVVSNNGIVNEIIPLSAHAVQVMDSLSQSILQVYITRIERITAATMEGKNK